MTLRAVITALAAGAVLTACVSSPREARTPGPVYQPERQTAIALSYLIDRQCAAPYHVTADNIRDVIDIPHDAPINGDEGTAYTRPAWHRVFEIRLMGPFGGPQYQGGGPFYKQGVGLLFCTAADLRWYYENGE